MAKTGRQIKWYRTPVERELLRELSRRSDLKGARQTLLFLGLYGLTLWGAWYVACHGPAAAAVGMVFLHGTVASFMINAVHELGHNTVFRSPRLNRLFEGLFAFLGWIHHEMFTASHTRHHAYTLHPPDDLEVVLPIRPTLRQTIRQSCFAWRYVFISLGKTLRLARGQFCGEWELALFPASAPEKRRPVVQWARALLIGHGLIVAASVALQLEWPGHAFWLLPVLITFGSFYGGGLHHLCNTTQHIGLQDNVPDFRLCCRTILINPVFRLLYWQMNYHIEHHAYPTVPCYNLGRLHRAIEYDLPPSPRGLIAAWREIAAILARQKQDPGYQYVAPAPLHPSDSSRPLAGAR